MTQEWNLYKMKESEALGCGGTCWQYV